jgi:hypothetical protein
MCACSCTGSMRLCLRTSFVDAKERCEKKRKNDAAVTTRTGRGLGCALNGDLAPANQTSIDTPCEEGEGSEERSPSTRPITSAESPRKTGQHPFLVCFWPIGNTNLLCALTYRYPLRCGQLCTSVIN